MVERLDRAGLIAVDAIPRHPGTAPLAPAGPRGGDVEEDPVGVVEPDHLRRLLGHRLEVVTVRAQICPGIRRPGIIRTGRGVEVEAVRRAVPAALNPLGMIGEIQLRPSYGVVDADPQTGLPAGAHLGAEQVEPQCGMRAAHAGGVVGPAVMAFREQVHPVDAGRDQRGRELAGVELLLRWRRRVGGCGSPSGLGYGLERGVGP